MQLTDLFRFLTQILFFLNINYEPFITLGKTLLVMFIACKSIPAFLESLLKLTDVLLVLYFPMALQSFKTPVSTSDITG